MTTATTHRIVLTGAESTGKTVLARRLAERFGAPWVPEFAREYADRVGGSGPLTVADVEPIARGQLAAEQAAEAAGHRLVIYDTDLLSTAVYARHYYGSCPIWVEQAVRQRAGLYLLLDVNVPFVADPTRGPPERRAELHRRFVAMLESARVDWRLVGGGWAERFEAAEEAVKGGRKT
jgi:NadR type nicotinamide-nucleotide adenylyltransferase